MFVNFTRPHAEFSPMTDSILYSLAANGVATLTLNRPELHNAIDDALIARLSELLDEAEANPDVRAGALTGNGLSFSSGWIKTDALHAGLQRGRASGRRPGAHRVLHKLDTLRLPTIASVQGLAFGVGAGLGPAAMWRWLPPKRCLASEVRLGLIPGLHRAVCGARAIGERSARRYFITAERFNAEKASAWGWCILWSSTKRSTPKSPT